MATETQARPLPKDLKVLNGMLSIFTLVNGAVGAFVQPIFASTLLIASVVAVVGGCITPVGIYFVKKATRRLSTKTSLLLCVFANVFGLLLAVTVDHFFVMIWGFVSTSVAIQFLFQYIGDVQISIRATEAEKAAWTGEMQLLPAVAFLVGCLLGPCVFPDLWHAQAWGLVLCFLASLPLLSLPSPASVKPPDAPWRLAELSKQSLPVLVALAMLAVHNNARDALLGPSTTYRFPELDSWAWGQLQFLGGLGGAIGMTLSMTFAPQASFSAAAVTMALSLCARVAEHHAQSFNTFMAATFAATIFKLMLPALLWNLIGASPHAPKAPVLQQAQAFMDGALGFVAPMTMLTVATVDVNMGRALYYLSGVLFLAAALMLPKRTAVAKKTS